MPQKLHDILYTIPVRISNRCGEINRILGKDITKFSNEQNLVKIHMTNYNHTLNHLADRCDEQTKQNRIKLFHLNIQSIKNRNHLIQIRELVYDKKVDVLAISQTWLNSTISNAEVEIQGYKIHRLDRKRKRGGGVCIYIRNNLKSKLLNDLSYISYSGLHQLRVQVQLNKNKFIIVCVKYKPPNCPVAYVSKTNLNQCSLKHS